MLMLVMACSDLLRFQHRAQEVVEERVRDDEAEYVFPTHEVSPEPFRPSNLQTLKPCPTTSRSGSRRRREPATEGGRPHPSSDHLQRMPRRGVSWRMNR